jgi:hypothetical protein
MPAALGNEKRTVSGKHYIIYLTVLQRFYAGNIKPGLLFRKSQACVHAGVRVE